MRCRERFVHALGVGLVAGLLAVSALCSAACGPAREAPTVVAATRAATEVADVEDGGAPIDLEEARKAVADFVLAVTHQRKDELRRTFSFRTLARDFQPRKVLELSPTLYARFAEDACARMLDPQGGVYRFLAGLEVGKARAHGGEVVVEGKGAAGDLKLHVGRRSTGSLHVLRIE